jgi:hypothetical protein
MQKTIKHETPEFIILLGLHGLLKFFSGQDKIKANTLKKKKPFLTKLSLCFY